MSSSVSGKILKAMSIFSGVQSIGILCSIVRTKLIALWIGEAGVGLFAIFNSVLEMVSSVTQLNMRQSAVRDISCASRSQVPKIAGVVRWWGWRLGIFGALVMLALSPLLSVISFGGMSYWWAFAILSVAVLALAYTNSEQAIMQGVNHLRPLAQSTLIGAVIGTVLSIPLYYWLGEGSIIPSLLVFAIVTSVAVRSLRDVRGVKSDRKTNLVMGRAFLSLGLYLTVSSFVTTASSYAFLSYLNHVADTDTVGLYQAGYTLVMRYTGIIFTALSMEFFPRISEVSDRPGMTSLLVSHELMLVMYVLMPLLVVFVAADKLIVWLLYKESFVAMLPFVTVGVGAMVFRAMSFCMAYVIVSRGDGRTYIVTEALSSAIGLTLNIVMYHYYSFVGLGISYILWYMLYTVIVGVVYRRYGMRLSRNAWLVSLMGVVCVGTAIMVKIFLGWICLLPLIALSSWVAYAGIRGLWRRRRV